MTTETLYSCYAVPIMIHSAWLSTQSSIDRSLGPGQWYPGAPSYTACISRNFPRPTLSLNELDERRRVDCNAVLENARLVHWLIS